MDLTETNLESPIGPLRLVATDAGLCRIAFESSSADLAAELERRFGGGRIAESGLAREDQFDLIGNRSRNCEVESGIGRSVRIAGEVAFENAVGFGSGF